MLYWFCFNGKGLYWFDREIWAAFNLQWEHAGSEHDENPEWKSKVCSVCLHPDTYNTSGEGGWGEGGPCLHVCYPLCGLKASASKVMDMGIETPPPPTDPYKLPHYTLQWLSNRRCSGYPVRCLDLCPLTVCDKVIRQGWSKTAISIRYHLTIAISVRYHLTTPTSVRYHFKTTSISLTEVLFNNCYLSEVPFNNFYLSEVPFNNFYLSKEPFKTVTTDLNLRHTLHIAGAITKKQQHCPPPPPPLQPFHLAERLYSAACSAARVDWTIPTPSGPVWTTGSQGVVCMYTLWRSNPPSHQTLCSHSPLYKVERDIKDCERSRREIHLYWQLPAQLSFFYFLSFFFFFEMSIAMQNYAVTSSPTF